MTTRSKYTTTRRADGGWKVPLAIKIGIAVIGSFFILIALIGSLVHGQTNMTAGFGTNATQPQPQTSTSGLDPAKGCIGNDQTTGKTFVNVDCLRNFSILRVLCDNWPGGNITIPQGLKCNPEVAYNATGLTNPG